MPNKGLRMLKHTRILMFLILGFFNFTINQDIPAWKEVFLVLCTLVFVINHFLHYNVSESEKKAILLCLLDFLSAAIIGFLFCLESNLYLIYFNVIGVTLFFETDNKRIIRTFIVSFFLLWGSISIYGGLVADKWHVFEDSLNVMFVLFGCIVGYLIRELWTARDTVGKQYEKLNDSHLELKDAHAQLGVYANQVEELTAIQERNRIARDIHDTVGHKMTALLIQLQLAGELANQNSEETKKTIATCETIARDALQEIRESVQTLRAEDVEPMTFSDSLKQLLHEFSSLTHIETTLNIEGDQSLVSPTIQPTLKRVVQESLTNAARHGKATRCNIQISCAKDKVLCNISDNGTGKSIVKPGFGLVNMRERVNERGGKLRVESEPDKGFTITAEFPLKQELWHSGGVL